MVDFNKLSTKKPVDKPLSSKTEPTGSKIPLPPGCKEDMQMGNEPIADIQIGEALTGHIIDIKPVKTPTMKNANNLITFNDEAYGTVKFWSSGALNQIIENRSDIKDLKITVQRIEDEQFKKGEGKNWRIFIHQKQA